MSASCFTPLTLSRGLTAVWVGVLAFNNEEESPEEKKANRPLRTKVSTKEFQKYDIDVEKIERGEDPRTTVMVRNVAGAHARKEFLQLLEKCGLGERFTFFYMPCKDRNASDTWRFVPVCVIKHLYFICRLYLSLLCADIVISSYTRMTSPSMYIHLRHKFDV